MASTQRNNLVLLGLILLVGCITMLGCAHSSDDDLIERFHADATLFEELARLTIDNPSVDGVRRAKEPADAGSDDHRDRARTLLRRLRLETTGISPRTNCVIMLDSYLGNSFKGYAYCPDPPSRVFPSLDNEPEDLEADVYGFRHINNAWYIFYWRT